MFYQTPRTYTDVLTGRTIRLFTHSETHFRQYRDEETGEEIRPTYTNSMGLPVHIRTEDGKEYEVPSMYCIATPSRPTHIKYYGDKRFRKI